MAIRFRHRNGISYIVDDNCVVDVVEDDVV